MFTLLGWVLQLMAFMWQPAQAILDTDDDAMMPFLQVSGLNDDEIAKRLHVLSQAAQKNIEKSKFLAFVQFIKELDGDLGQTRENTHWDRAASFWEFVDASKIDTEDKDKLWLSVFALTYGVFTPKTQGVAGDFFLQEVKSFTLTLEDWTLQDFAEDFLVQLDTKKQKAMGCVSGDCAALLTQRAPRKVLQSWITMNVFQIRLPAIHDQANLLKNMVTSFCMTSVKDRLDAITAAKGTGTEEGKKTAEHYRVGLLLHLFEVLYSCEEVKADQRFAQEDVDALDQSQDELFKSLAVRAGQCLTTSSQPRVQQGIGQ